MKLTALSAGDASALSARTLGLDPDLISLTSTEGLAASLRRAASLLCPTSPNRLVDAVRDAVGPACPAEAVDRDKLTEILDLLISAGDLLELRQTAERSIRLLYLGPPSYVERFSGSYLLLGVRPYGAPLVEVALAEHIELEGHTRTVKLDPAEAPRLLARNGLQPLGRERWAASPARIPATELIERIRFKLDAAGASGDVEELEILDPAMSVRFYRGRWQTPAKTHNGDFLGRRKQAYGAPLWCAVRIENGAPKKLMEFPIDNPAVPARDESWRYQMAIDEVRGTPQVYRVTAAAGRDECVVSFLSPLPGFAERYLQLVGLALPDAPLALFTFRVPSGAIPDLRTFLTDMLWMKLLPEESAR